MIILYKPLGLTPVQLIEQFRSQNPEHKDVKIGFAGRLDPLAHGVMLLMIGDENKNRERFMGLDKEYEFEVILGFSTDSYDLLGFITQSAKSKLEPDFHGKINHFIQSKLGTSQQPFPPFSSKPVQGRPMYYWAKRDLLPKIQIPSKEITVYSFELLETGSILKSSLSKLITSRINLVQGEFRQSETLDRWMEALKISPLGSYTTFKFKISCSSGTYVRGLVNELSNYLNYPATTLEINRTKVGKFKLDK